MPRVYAEASRRARTGGACPPVRRARHTPEGHRHSLGRTLRPVCALSSAHPFVHRSLNPKHERCQPHHRPHHRPCRSCHQLSGVGPVTRVNLAATPSGAGTKSRGPKRSPWGRCAALPRTTSSSGAVPETSVAVSTRGGWGPAKLGSPPRQTPPWRLIAGPQKRPTDHVMTSHLSLVGALHIPQAFVVRAKASQGTPAPRSTVEMADARAAGEGASTYFTSRAACPLAVRSRLPPMDASRVSFCGDGEHRNGTLWRTQGLAPWSPPKQNGLRLPRPLPLGPRCRWGGQLSKTAASGGQGRVHGPGPAPLPPPPPGAGLARHRERRAGEPRPLLSVLKLLKLAS